MSVLDRIRGQTSHTSAADIAIPPEDTEVELRSAGTEFSISDGDALAEYLGLSGSSLAGVAVTERSALGVPAFYRVIDLISGTIAGLPLKTYRDGEDGRRERVPSFLDRPAGPYPLTAFAWKKLVLTHLLIRGESFLTHIYNGAGALIGLWPTHPVSVDVQWKGTGKVFRVGMADGSTRTYDRTQMTQVMGMTTDGKRGISPLSVFRNAIGTGIAGDQAAARSFGNGNLIAGLVTPEEDVSEEDAKEIKAGLKAKVSGVENAGDIAVINRKLKFTPWAMTLDDAQFIQSREFQIIEFCRMLGVPPHLVGATEKQTSWGTGVAEQNLGLARYTLMEWTTAIEEALSELMPAPRFCEFDYKGLLQGTPKEELEMLKVQLDAGIITIDEARAILNLPPLIAAQKADPTPPPAAPPEEIPTDE